MTADFIRRALLPALLILAFHSCKDDDGLDLPPPTTIGKMTFGCKIDGKNFLPGGIGGGVNSETDGTGWGYVSGSNSNTNSSVAIVINRPGYSLKQNVQYDCDQEKIFCSCISSSGGNACYFEELPISGGIVFTKIDSVNRIASGTFEFTAYSASCDKTTKVTDGRFDVKFTH